MSLNKSIFEDAMKRVTIEIGRVKSRRLFPISLFTIHFSSSRTLATLRDMPLPKLLSGELSVGKEVLQP